MTNRILTAAFALSFLALPALAEEQTMPGGAGNILDKNGDGVVTLDEMDAFSVMIFPALDTNGDGKIDKTEALVVFTEEQFKAIDANGDGVITQEELTATVRADFKSADIDGNGQLN